MTQASAYPLVCRASNLLWERRLGISTRGTVPTDHPDSVHYATMNYQTIWAVLRHLRVGPADVFVDIGCGKGRVLCCAARRGARAYGVDVSADLCDDARRNAQRLRGRHAPITVETALAQNFDYTQATVLYLFDPFGPVTCEDVLKRISKDTAGRGIRIAYANPAHEDVFDRQPWLEQTDRWDRAETGREHTVTFYRSFA